MAKISKCTKALDKCSVEQTATLRVWSEKKGLNVDKHRVQVEQTLDEDED